MASVRIVLMLNASRSGMEGVMVSRLTRKT